MEHKRLQSPNISHGVSNATHMCDGNGGAFDRAMAMAMSMAMGMGRAMGSAMGMAMGRCLPQVCHPSPKETGMVIVSLLPVSVGNAWNGYGLSPSLS